METRNITVTIEQAREWYNSDNVALKKLALEAFTEDELNVSNFKSITTVNDVLCALNIEPSDFIHTIKHLENYSKASAASYKLSLIRKALNVGHKMNFTDGHIWYPYCPFTTEKSTYFRSKINSGEMEVVAKFKIDEENYLLLGGFAVTGGSDAGLGAFISYDGVGNAFARIGFLGCATKEVAQHMGKYFAKEIFEAKYGDFVDFEWVD